MRRQILLSLLLASAAPAAFAATAERDLDITIYPQNQALIEDTRPLTFAAGREVIAFPDVSAEIRPETASLSAEGVTTLEQNFDYDLLTPQKLMEKALGQQIKIVRTNPGTGVQAEETATVLSTQNGVVLKVGDRIEVLRDDGVPTRVIFDKVPDTLKAQPTLSILTQSRKAGTRPATLTYMTGGLSWSVDYVATYDEKAKTVDLQGWVTLNNQTGVAYDGAHVKIASDAVSGGGLKASGGENDGNARSELFTLPEAVTIQNRQAKQIGIASLRGVKAEKIYRSSWWSFQPTSQPAQADVVLRFDAKDGAGATWRLPGGPLRAFLRDAKGEAQFVGETQIPDTAAGGKVLATISRAFDIQVEQKVVSDYSRFLSGAHGEVAYHVTNASNAPVTVEVEQGGLGANLKVLKESAPHEQPDAYHLVWKVQVPAHGATDVTAELAWGGL